MVNSSSSDLLDDSLEAEERFDGGLGDRSLLGLELVLPVLALLDLPSLFNSSSSDFLGESLDAEEPFEEGLGDRRLLGLELILPVLALLDLPSFDEELRDGRLFTLELPLLDLLDLLFFTSDMVG